MVVAGVARGGEVTKHPRLEPLIVFLAAALFFILGATDRDLWTTGEHRYAEVARVLTAPGADHLVPHLNGEIYPDKPPLFFWAAGAGHRLLGLDLPLSAKLPSILGGSFTVMLTFLLGRRWYGTAGGVAAVGVLATVELFDWASRMAHIDAFLTTLITTVLYCYVRADETPRQERGRRSLWTALGFLAVGLGILVKGPPAPFVPGITILVFLLWCAPRELVSPRFAWGALLALLPGLLWSAAVVGHLGLDGAKAYLWGDLLHGQAIGHAAGEIDKQQPWFYYLWNVPLHLMPWTLFLPAALWAALGRGRPEERRTDRFLVAWLIAPWVLFSFSPAKRELYMVPIHPAAALLVARLFRDALEQPERLRDALVAFPRNALAVAGVAVGALVALFAALVASGADRSLLDAATAHVSPRLADWKPDWEHLRAELSTGLLLLAILLGALVAAAGVRAWRASTAARAGAALVAIAAGWNLLNAMVLWPARDADQSPRAFLEDVRARVGSAPVARLGRDGGLQYVVNWTLGRDHVDEFENVKRAGDFLAKDPASPRYVVTDGKELGRFGVVPGAVEILRRERHRGLDLVLLGNAAAAR